MPEVEALVAAAAMERKMAEAEAVALEEKAETEHLTAPEPEAAVALEEMAETPQVTQVAAEADVLPTEATEEVVMVRPLAAEAEVLGLARVALVAMAL